MLTGDIEEEGEKDLCAHLQDMNITVLKVAHHGSRNATSDDFLKLVHPQAAVISAGVDNLYGHPHKETIQRISSCNPCPDIYRTDLAGEVSIRWEKKKEKWNMFVQVYREKSACPPVSTTFGIVPDILCLPDSNVS